MANVSAICNKAALKGIIALVVVCCFSFDAFGQSLPAATFRGIRSGAHGREHPGLLAYENKNQEAVSNENGFRKNYRQWKNLPPEEKKQLRNRMNQYKKMPPQDKQQYRQKLEKWKKLPPEDRRRIQQSLKEWKDLSPEEKNAVRRRLGNE